MPRISNHSRKSKEVYGGLVEITENNQYNEAIYLPNPEESGESDTYDDDEDSGDRDVGSSDDESSDDGIIDCNFSSPKISYAKIFDQYDLSQKTLEDDHHYNWIDGEKHYPDDVANKNLLSEKDKKIILSSTPTKLFEYFFSDNLKKVIIECTESNGYQLTRDRFDVFLGILLFSSYNTRHSQRDYWSTNSLLRADPVVSAMGRTEFEEIKSNLKYSKPEEENKEDRIWRVRRIVDIFNKNIKRFNFFSTALSIDEMMAKYYGRCVLKQFIKGKPIRFGIKLWALCSYSGFLFHFEIYCGKNAKDNLLPNIALGSRVVLQMLQPLLHHCTPRKLNEYHCYFDNLFCCPDLLLHLKKIGLRATGTVRSNRIKATNDINKKAKRGTWLAKHDKLSGINFITVMDSKPVSILSTASGVTPMSNESRYDKESRSKRTIPFPNAFCIYNKFMGGVDLHDQHANQVRPNIHSKKWTWIILIRLVQAAVTNATVLYNEALPNTEKKKGTKEFVLSISENYLSKGSYTVIGKHEIQPGHTQHSCQIENCATRTRRLCKQCNLHVCKNCSGIPCKRKKK